MVFIIILKSTGKRARHLDGTLVPVMEHYAQADRYLFKRLGNSELMTIIERRK